MEGVETREAKETEVTLDTEEAQLLVLCGDGGEGSRARV